MNLGRAVKLVQAENYKPTKWECVKGKGNDTKQSLLSTCTHTYILVDREYMAKTQNVCAPAKTNTQTKD